MKETKPVLNGFLRVGLATTILLTLAVGYTSGKLQAATSVQSTSTGTSQKEAMLVTKLESANHSLALSIKSGRVAGDDYDLILKQLEAILADLKLRRFADETKLNQVLRRSQELLFTYVEQPYSKELASKKSKSWSILYDVLYQMDQRLNEKWKATQAASSEMRVEINGKVQEFDEEPIIQNQTVLVPMRGLFETFGATIIWDSKTQTVTAIQDGVKISLKIGDFKASINGKVIELSTPATSNYGTTRVPLRFVAQALKADVKFNSARNVVEIIAPGVRATRVVSANKTWKDIRVKYGSHTYGVDNQSQYDTVMTITAEAIQNASTEVPPVLKAYLDGERFDGDMQSEDEKNITLKQLDDRLGALVEAGVPRETIEKLVRGTGISNQFARQAKDNGDAAAQYSAYHTLIQKETDCDSTAQTYMAVLDQMGFSTGVYYTEGHADGIVHLPRYGYYVMMGGHFGEVFPPTFMRSGHRVMEGFNE